MQITKINKIKNTGILQDLNWDNLRSKTAEENFDFKQVNLIFGWNGTGKTTLSRVLRNLEIGEVCKRLEKYSESEYEILLDNGSKATHENISGKFSIRIFNKDFIEENIFRSEEEGKNVLPLYYLGDAKIELTKERKERDGKQVQLDSILVEINETIRAKEKFAKDSGKYIKDILLGIKEFQFYNMASFTSAYGTLKEDVENKTKDLNILKLDQATFDSQLRLVKNSEALQKWIDDIELTSDAINETLLNNISNLLEKQVSVQKTIAKLETNWQLSQWVQEGLVIHTELNTEMCEFCGQNLPPERISEIEQHFNKDYLELSNALGKQIESLKGLIIREEEKIPDDQIKTLAKGLNEIISKIISELDAKQKNILAARLLASTTKDVINQDIEKITRSIEERKKSFLGVAKTLELSLLSEKFNDYTSLSDKLLGLEVKRDKLKQQISDLSTQIQQSEKDVMDFKLPASEINKDLEKFLGHDELTLEDHTDEYGEISYLIKRNDEVASNLSEAEKTAISLIYFLRKLNENGFDLKKGIVVIDDPISSMDSQFLYCAYAFIVAAIEKPDTDELQVGQFILLTHNYDFFNLFKKKYKNKIDKQKCGMYMLRVGLNTDSKRVATLHHLDPLLKKFDSDYQYLFSKLLEFESATEDKKSELSFIYNYPNIARRVLETFLSFKFPSKTNYKQKIDSAQGEKTDKESVYRFTNIQSHGTIREAESFSPEIVEPTAGLHILNVLKLMRLTDGDHVKEMANSIK